MKGLVVALALLAPLAASAANPPQLVCDPDARVTFHTTWFGTNTVTFSADVQEKLPWTGHERLTTGAQLSELAGDGPEELRSLPGSASFVTFVPREQLSPTLYVASDLLSGTEQDGLVVASIDAGAGSQFRVYHCRSR